MRYLLLIHAEETRYPEIPPQEIAQLKADYEAFRDELKQAGAYLAYERLRPTTAATTLRVRHGETLITDGPFAETKEQLGGFYLIHANDLDEALAWATKMPSARYGSIEVRPIWE
jgi:hypothetical protein